MIDTHAHLDLPVFDGDRAEVLARAQEAGVEAIIMPAISPEGFPKARGLVEESSFPVPGGGDPSACAAEPIRRAGSG